MNVLVVVVLGLLVIGVLLLVLAMMLFGLEPQVVLQHFPTAFSSWVFFLEAYL